MFGMFKEEQKGQSSRIRLNEWKRENEEREIAESHVVLICVIVGVRIFL